MMRYALIFSLLLCTTVSAVEQVADINGYKAGVDSAAPTTPLLELGANQDWGDMLVHNAAITASARAPFVVDTVANLQALAAPYLIDGQTYRTLRYSTSHTVGDGSGNTYRYVDADATTADGGFVISHADGRFHALDKSVAKAIQFGVRVGESAANNATYLANAIAAASAGKIGVQVQAGEIDITTIDLSDFTGSFFRGEGRQTAGTEFVIDGTQTYGIRLETINECRVSDFIVTGSSDVTHGIYMYEFRRSFLENVRVIGCVNNITLGFCWLTNLVRCTSQDPATVGFLFDGVSINNIDVINCNNTASGGTATWGVNLDDANEVKFLGFTNEGSDGAGIRIGGGCRVVSFDGVHIETEGNGFYMQSNSSSPIMCLSIRNAAMFLVDSPITCSTTSPGSLEFSQNFIQPATSAANVVINLQAYDVEARGNVVQGATASQLANAYTFGTSPGRVKVPSGHDHLEFGLKYINFTKNRLILSGYSAALADIDTYRKIQPGCAGKFTMVKEVSGTETAIDTWLFRVNADDSITAAQIAGESSGTALITALGYNGTTDLLQVQSASGTGSAFVKIETLVDY